MIVFIFLGIFVICCLSASGIAAVSMLLNASESSSVPELEVITGPGSSGPEPTAPELVVSTEVVTETLAALESEDVPIYDPIVVAEQLENKQNLPRSLEFPVQIYQAGDVKTFWVINSDTNINFQVPAVLRYVSDHVYFWIEEGFDYDEKEVRALVENFEEKTYPTNREFFGSEWTPGVDADPHLFILYAGGLGGSVAGYFSSADEYLPVVQEYANGHEMFLMSTEHVDLDDQFAYSVLAHEFQHMIHWYRDRNEETWIDEGSAELAAFLNGYSVGGHDRSFALNPDIQLTDWPNDSGSRSPNYGASFLFMTYFLDRFGEDATKALVYDPSNGMVSIDNVLAQLGVVDPLSSAAVTADDVFMDWLAANILQDSNVADGRYDYQNYPGAPDFDPTETITDCPVSPGTRTVHQYGVNYIEIRCKGEHLIKFTGSTQVPVLPVDPHSGSYAFYSNRGNESNMTLTREFDFTNLSGPLTMQYWTWYDLEKDYDYLYLTASLDGEDWQIQITPSGTAEDPSGNSYGWGYNGVSTGGGWILEEVDLSEFAGKKVQLRFQYITDAAVNGEGFLIDDIAVPQVDYFADFETDDGGWNAEGFARIQNTLPQTFRLAVISRGRATTVQMFPVAPGENVEIPITTGGEIQDVILIVTGTSRFTRQSAVYSLSVQPK